MDYAFIFSILGFLLASYAVVANDSVQTLGTFIASNSKVRWQYLWAAASLVLILTLVYSWVYYSGDISHGRLDKIPYKPIEWYHVAAPLILLVLTRLGIPVSTSFLVLSAFASSFVLEKILLKSMVGYAVAGVFGYSLWLLVCKFYVKDDISISHNGWRVLQWISTGILWSMWLSHDLANIAVFLPRELSIEELVCVILVFVSLLGFMFREGGGKIQEVVAQKTSTSYVRAATLIDLSYAFILWYFKQYNDIPMSTTWVFVGLLAGRELALATGKKTQIGTTWPLISKDFMKMLVGLGISILVALFVQGM